MIAGVVSVATGLTALLPVQVEAVGNAVLAGAAVMLALVLYGTATGHRAAGQVPPDSDGWTSVGRGPVSFRKRRPHRRIQKPKERLSVQVNRTFLGAVLDLSWQQLQ